MPEGTSELQAVDIVSPIDLHTHTTASDGLLAPAALVHLASERGLSVLAVTDHDTIDGIAEAFDAVANSEVILIPGVELSTTVGKHEVHILGYFVDVHDEVFLARLADLGASRVRRIVRIVERLNEVGYPIAIEPILAQAVQGTIGRPHVARALMEIGAVQSVGEAFDRFLTVGKPGWIPREQFTPEDAVALLLDNGAIPVLAHPYTTGDVDGTLDVLIPAGLRGIEVFYGEYDAAQHDALLTIAKRRGLLPTGGSDYHGPRFKEGRELGFAPVPSCVVVGLMASHAEEDHHE